MSLLVSVLSAFFLSSSIPVHASPVAPTYSSSNGVQTTSGTYIGHLSKFSNVTEFLGIQYAQPPTGNLRFAAPVAFTSDESLNASIQPHDCPYVAQPWGYFPGTPWETANWVMAQESADGYNAMSEDCLRLNIWAPFGSVSGKPVLVFLYGGGFDRGSVKNPAYNGVYMAAKEDVVVVTFNYRVNIFGLSNAPGADSNVAMRDMRLAVEWVRDNIAAFGGDTSRITLFGQSQGAYLISYYAYAFRDDPIASSFIQESGSAFAPAAQNSTVTAVMWRNASATVGCNQTDDAAVLECMRGQNVSTVLQAWKAVQPTGNTLKLPFSPEIVDLRQLYGQNIGGRIRSEGCPFLLGSNANEAGFYNKTSIGFGTFFCPIVVDAKLKGLALAGTDIPVFRYEYFGDWPNLRLFPDSGAYHTSEISMFLGTSPDLSGRPNTPLQNEVSAYMMHAYASFARDSKNGLQGLSWPRYKSSEDTLVRLGYGEETAASFVSPTPYDTTCVELEKLKKLHVV